MYIKLIKKHEYFRALFCKLDGTTSGPNSFKGPIGRNIGRTELDDLPFVKFDKIDGEILVPLSVSTDLSTDQAQLFAFVTFITTGKELPAIYWKLGNLCHSRWLTMGTRVLAEYTKTENPSPELQTLAKYVIQVYASSWFNIKCNGRWYNGPSNLFFIMKKILTQDRDVISIVQPAVQRNAYFALPDNVLGAMLRDEDGKVRQKAINMITEIRSDKPDTFCSDRALPDLNWDAEHYSEIINWNELSWEQICEPALTVDISVEELKDGPLFLGGDLYCHTQCVERGVRLVSESAKHSYNPEERHGTILSGIESRSKRSKIETKDSYEVVHLNTFFSFLKLYILFVLFKMFTFYFYYTIITF